MLSLNFIQIYCTLPLVILEISSLMLCVIGCEIIIFIKTGYFAKHRRNRKCSHTKCFQYKQRPSFYPQDRGSPVHCNRNFRRSQCRT